MIKDDEGILWGGNWFYSRLRLKDDDKQLNLNLIVCE
jgi:hypothetical protein